MKRVRNISLSCATICVTLLSLLFVNLQTKAGCDLSVVSTTPVDTEAYLIDVAFSSDGSCLAVSTSDSIVYTYAVNADYSLTSTATLTTGINTSGYLAFSTDGSCLAIANINNVVIFSMDGCTPTSSSPSMTLTSNLSAPNSIAFSPNGCFAVTDVTLNSVVLFAPPTSGCNYVNSSVIYPVGSGPASLAFSNDGSCLAVANYNDGNANTISVFSVSGSNCTTLTEVTGSPFATDAGAYSVAYSSDGNCLAVACNTTTDIFTMNGCTPNPSYSVISTPTPYVAFFSPNSCLTILNFNEPNLYNYPQVSGCNYNSSPSIVSLDSNPLWAAYSSTGLLAVITADNNIQILEGPVGYQPVVSIAPGCSGCLNITGYVPNSAGLSTTVAMSGPGIATSYTQTDANGNFSFQICPTQSNYTLTFTASNINGTASVTENIIVAYS